MAYLFSAAAAMLAALILLIYINPGPGVKQDRRTAWLKRMPIAHRGLHSNDAHVPENSLKAFWQAVERGYAIELDVQLTADGKVIAFHDYNLKRMTGLNKQVSDVTWAKMQQLRLLDSDQGIPLLSDVLDLVAGTVPLLIEVKNESQAGRLEAAIIETLNNYRGEYAVQAFNPFVLQYFRHHAPWIIRGQLAGSFKGENLAWWKKILLRYLLLNHISCPQFVAYETGALPRWMARRLKQKGLYILTWTVKNSDGFSRDIKLADNVIFENFLPLKQQA